MVTCSETPQLPSTKRCVHFKGQKACATLTITPNRRTYTVHAHTNLRSGYAAHLVNAEGVLYGTELGSVTLKRVGLFCFPIKHSTYIRTDAAVDRDHIAMQANYPFFVNSLYNPLRFYCWLSIDPHNAYGHI